MPVLKQHHNTPAMREAIVLDLGDIGAQAARIRLAAETQAQQIIAEAQAKAEALARQQSAEAQESGYAEGLECGLAEGRAKGRAEALEQAGEHLQQLTAAWSQVARDWEQQRTEMEREARQAVLMFALRAAEKVVHRVIEVDESVIVDQAAQALSMVLSAHDASVRMHPVDRPMLEDALPELLQELATLQHIELIDDDEVTPGGCVVAFGQGRVDATIETQIKRLIDLILPEPPPPAIDEMEPESPQPPAPATAQAAEAPAPNAAEPGEAHPLQPEPEPEAPEPGVSDAGQVDEPDSVDPGDDPGGRPNDTGGAD